MTHPNEDLIRSAYAAFAKGDLPGYLEFCAPGITFTVPGRSPVAGTYTREQFFEPFIGQVMRLTGGTFRETVLDVAAGETLGAVYLEHSFERGGTTFTYRTTHLYAIENGRLASFRELPDDLYAFDAAWS